jgi:HK97 family phage major capsid protein
MREHIISLQRQVATKTAGLQALVDKAEGENRDLTAEEQATFAKGETEVKALKARLERATSVEREAATVTTPVLVQPDKPSGATPSGLVTPIVKELPAGVAFARLVAARAAAGRGTPADALAWYKKNFGEGDDIVVAALNATTLGDGAYTVPTTLAAQLIPLLQAKTVLGRAGVPREPLPNGQITIVRSLTGAAFTRVAEGTGVNASSPTFGAVTLTAKKMIGKIAISNDLIRYSAYRIDASVERDAMRGLQVAEDGDFIRGTGVGAIPKGMLYIATGANLLTMTGTPSVTTIVTDLQRTVAALANANIPMMRCFWAFAPRVAFYLQWLLNSAGFKVFPEMMGGTLMGFPYFTTTAIPINLSPGTVSEFYFADADELIIGDGLNIKVDVSQEASYLDETGTLVSAFDKDQTIVRLMLANDFAAFHPQAVCCMNGVTWGA